MLIQPNENDELYGNDPITKYIFASSFIERGERVIYGS